MAQILVVDDEKKMGFLVGGALEDAGHNLTICTSGNEALEQIQQKSFDIVVTDLKMEPPDGMEILRAAKEASVECEVIMMTAFASAQTAVEAMKAGAYDYLIKPFSLDELVLLVQRILSEKKKDARREQLECDLESFNYDEFIGNSPPVRELLSMVEKVAATEANVLILGKSGTGKELIANMVHKRSSRSAGPFVAVNCAALTETLLESELFGHERGAFTGAIRRKLGRFELAENGTLFLDEVGEIKPSVQVKLLRALEQRKIVRVGGTDEIAINVRVISATNRDIENDMETGQFREDLFYRLNVFPVQMPTLAERADDIPILAEYFSRKLNRRHSKLTPDVLNHLVAYHWPGNVRELKNVLERAMILAAGDELSPEHLALKVKPRQEVRITGNDNSGLALDDLEKQAVLDALKKAAGNRTKAAKLLNITRRMLYSRLKKYGIE
ncbi:MAG: sigma-54 dependent transcriptional regulator [candidate division Zixibacteria bacterium]|nr:sigma-54 dependent transcriptional regulator [candidate division Zixibacteria bacterium]MBU1471326.1 sigma-54 dependent transcriptional regulator [candidate division Zixibacteria bacterium]MBU2625801.1 sigma-54 dependent transcriptional regulator [candidate division Zixibacteria bacterium]